MVSVWQSLNGGESVALPCDLTLDPMGHLDDHSGHPQQVPHDSAKDALHHSQRDLSGYAELARSVGLDPHRLMRRCGLNPSCLSDPDARIDAAAVAELLETSAAESRVEDFGVRLSTARRLSNLGPFSLVVRRKPRHGAPSKRSAAICSCTANCSPSASRTRASS